MLAMTDSKNNLLALELFPAVDNFAFLFIAFQNELGDGLLHAFDSREFFGDEISYFSRRFSGNNDNQVDVAGDEVDGARLRETVNLFGDGVETDVFLRGELDADERPDLLLVRLVPVDDRLLAQDDAVFFCLLYLFNHLFLGKPGHDGNLLRGCPRVAFQDAQNFF